MNISDTLELEELGMRNFMSYGNNYTVINLRNPGTTLIVGEDIDAGTGSSNGVGKTTILAGIVYALFDRPLNDKMKVDELINNVNKKNMEVYLKFRKRGDLYTIKRIRKGKDGNTVILEKNGVAITRDSVDNTNKYLVDQIIGYSFHLFVRIVVFSAGHDHFLSLPTSGAKKPLQSDIIEELFNLTSLSLKANKLKADIKDNEQKMNVIKAKIDQIERERERHTAQVKATKQRMLEWEANHTAKIEEIHGQLEEGKDIDLDYEIQLHKDIEQLTAANKQLKIAYARAVEWEESHQAKLDRTTKELADFEDIDFHKEEAIHNILETKTKQHRELVTAHSRMVDWATNQTKRIEDLRYEVAALERIDYHGQLELHKEIASLKTEQKTVQTALNECLRLEKQYKAERDKLKTEHKHLEDAKCPYCLQDYAEAKEKCSTIEKMLEELSAKFNTLDNEEATYSKQNDILLTKLTELQAKVTHADVEDLQKTKELSAAKKQRFVDLVAEKNPHVSAVEELLEVDPGTELINMLGDDAIAKLGVEIEEAKDALTIGNPQTLAKLKSNAVVLKEKLEHLKSESNPHIETLKEHFSLVEGDDYKAIGGELYVAKSTISSHELDILGFKERTKMPDLTAEEVIDLKNERKVLKEKLAQLESAENPHIEALEELLAVNMDDAEYDMVNEHQHLVDHQKFLVKLLTKTDSFIRKELIDQNVPLLNKRLKKYLSDLGLPHKVEFTNTMTASITQMGRPLSYHNLSTGQQARVNLALSFAFRDVLQAMHSPVNFCLLDEVLDVGLCAYGIGAAARMLKNKAREEKITMFVISHKAEVDSVFDRTMKVEMTKGFSRIVAS